MFEEVRKFIVEKVNCDSSKIELETELASLGIDSLQLMMLINDFEERFDCKISDEELESINQVKDLVKKANHE